MQGNSTNRSYLSILNSSLDVGLHAKRCCELNCEEIILGVDQNSLGADQTKCQSLVGWAASPRDAARSPGTKEALKTYDYGTQQSPCNTGEAVCPPRQGSIQHPLHIGTKTDTGPKFCLSTRIKAPSIGAIILCCGTSLHTSVSDLSEISLDNDDLHMLWKDFKVGMPPRTPRARILFSKVSMHA